MLFAESTFAATLPPGFQEEIVISGLTEPTAVRFASDGRVFVAEKSGIIKVFDSLSDTTPTVFVDLRTKVHNFWDRGLLDLALAPNFPSNPWVYVIYTHDAAIGGNAPRWGSVGGTSDGCEIDALDDGCVVSGRISRLEASGNVAIGLEQVLIEDWCQQYPSHSIGSLAFGADGALYASGGDGASFNFVDYGQDGSPLNPCGDPPGGVGGNMSPPTAEGGALRSQDVRTTSDPTSLDGAIIRINPTTGAGMPDNPMASSSDLNARRIVAYGLRNPFRITIRPGTNEVWLGDVGWNDWEEVNRLISPSSAPVENFGWPCYEGDGIQRAYDSANLNLCESLYAAGSGAVVAPYFRYHHNELVVPNDICPLGGSSVAGTSFAFSTGGSYPAEYRGALFFADYTRRCIWAVPLGTNGLPDISRRRTFAGGAAQPVQLQIGPNGDLFYVDLGGTIRRIRYFSANQPPVAVASANPTSGAAPLTVSFNGSASSDPDGDVLTYAWDLDGDGAFDDAAAATASFTYTQPGTYIATLRVTDTSGSTGTSAVTISVGNTPPTAIIDTPLASTTWAVGDNITFSGRATDAQSGNLPASALTWNVVLLHCPSTCHEHPLQTFSGVASGSFPGPDHEYPTRLEFRLTATDPGGLSHTTSVQINPRTVDLTFQSSPTGLSLAVGSTSQATPFTRTAITGSTLSISATSPQTLSGTPYEFVSWSDGGAQTHNITASASGSRVATYQVRTGGPVITNVVARPGPNRVTITWITDVPAHSQVDYGPTPSYGSSIENRELVTNHTITIIGLARKTQYYFLVRSRDAVGSESTAAGSFRTK
ncbi:MAG TPA: PQQ-dependent sugar dehydrogenase [Steroidobacter sp.]|uniref:PQQ-dependent sugar dehydrogenase n=1 Tax=Steroidobacter sp. TaxID=1978227 RepID=UPI002EDB6A1E